MIFILTALFGANFLPGIAMAETQVLTWQDCVKEAAENHPDLISAEEAVKQSEAAKDVAASALFPQIDATVNASRAKSPSKTSGAKGTTTNSYAYGATGSQLIFDGLKTINDVKAARQNIEATRYNYKFTSTEIRLRLRTAFVNLLKAQKASQLDPIEALRYE